MDHGYPPVIVKKREYSEICKVLKENKVLFQTLFPARLRVRYDDGTKTYNTIEEASDDLLRRGYVLSTIKPAETLKEQVQRLTCTRVERRATKGARQAGQESTYKENLRTFRRASPGPSGPQKFNPQPKTVI